MTLMTLCYPSADLEKKLRRTKAQLQLVDLGFLAQTTRRSTQQQVMPAPPLHLRLVSSPFDAHGSVRAVAGL